MKKKILMFVLIVFSLVSCGKETRDFDTDFTMICDKLKDDKCAFNILTHSDESEYIFKIENVSLKIRAYYKAYKEQFRKILMLSFDYVDTDINNIRIASICINENNSTIGQVGFSGDKMNISKTENASENRFKGIQIFLSPYEENSRVRFYFECENFMGSFYQIDGLKEYGV